jgi:NAD(P)-dependent dehydrogenase (short-subunit alcohol dehydrogenase family)
LRLLADGWRVAAVDIDPNALQSAWSGDGRVLQLVADVSDPAQVTAAAEKALQGFGRIDAVVNNAAVHGSSWNDRCLDYNLSQWTHILNVNLLGPINVVRATVSALASSSGVVVNVSSASSYTHQAGSPYAVVKSALNGLTASLAADLGPSGIRVVGVAPGIVMTRALAADVPVAAAAAYTALQAMTEIGSPEAIADVIAFLVSTNARMITGHTVIADLGITRRP